MSLYAYSKHNLHEENIGDTVDTSDMDYNEWVQNNEWKLSSWEEGDN